MALLVAAALATGVGRAGRAGDRSATTPPAAPSQQQAPPADEQAEAPNVLLAVPLKLLSVLDQDFSLGPWTFRGYIQFDGADYTQPAAGPPETDFRRGAIGSGDTLDARALADGSYLRKARLGGEGTLGRRPLLSGHVRHRRPRRARRGPHRRGLGPLAAASRPGW